MLARLRAKLSYANVVSTLALCLVVGGGSAYAVTQIDANSVRSDHIVNGQVKSVDIANDGIRAVDIEGFSLLKNIGQIEVNPSTGNETDVVELMSTEHLTILGSCHRSEANEITAKLLVSSSTSGAAFTSTATPDGFIVNPGDGNREVAALAEDQDEPEQGLITFDFARSSEVIHGTVSALVNSPWNGPNDCVFTGYGLG